MHARERRSAGDGHDAVSSSARPRPAVLTLQRAVGNRALQRHSSFEHRLLGDAPAADLDNVARRINPATRRHVLETERERLRLWQRDPESVTEAQVRARWPDARVFTLHGSRLVVTYGELNTLGDYLPTPGAVDGLGREILLPILQLVRQQGFNRISDLLDDTRDTYTSEAAQGAIAGLGGGVELPQRAHPHESFAHAVGPVGEVGTIASIEELSALNRVTARLGPNQYQSLVSRNACHFAPYSWHRWEDHHRQARELAERGRATGDPELIRQAWITNGYADHFLQDSFAAGHLINKTLIMQWFVEWVEDYNASTSWYERNIHIDDWDLIRTMTTARQPGLAGHDLYQQGPVPPGGSVDPQTAEEQMSRQARMDAAGVRAAPGQTQAEAYRAYLAFLNSATVQAAAGALHDYFNERSLTVTSPAYPQGFQVWGDETLVTSGDGVRIAAETAELSQQAIDDIAHGRTPPTVERIRSAFPTAVRPAGQATAVPLEHWNHGLHDLCRRTIFPDVHYRILSGRHMGTVSRDVREPVAAGR